MRKLLLTTIVAITATALCSYAEEPKTVTDICGNSYPIVKIGTQYWMGENMKCNKYDTQSEAYNAKWLTNNTISTSSSLYSYSPFYNDATNKTKWNKNYVTYGEDLTDAQIAKLGFCFNYAAAVGVANGESQRSEFEGERQGICPNGWHVPSSKELFTLANFIDSNRGLTNSGKKLKATSGWYDGNTSYIAGTDDYGFMALPAGYSKQGEIFEFGLKSFFWSSTPTSSSMSAYAYVLEYSVNSFCSDQSHKGYGRSVRCIQNTITSVEETESSSYSPVTKQIIDGRVVIIKGDKKFDLSGKEIK